MSLYKNEITINGIKCGLVLREGDGYLALFEREFAGLEDIEGIDWSAPDIAGDCILPEGYGFEVHDIAYSHGEKCWRVRLTPGRQYLGDVTGYQAQIDALEEQQNQTEQALDLLREERDALQAQLNSVDPNAVGESELMDAYAEGVNSDE